jgi:subtilisin family serine protease
MLRDSNVPNNPMETYPGHPGNPTPGNSSPGQWTSHGTHVAGIAMGRNTGMSMGIAPGVMAIHFRALGFGGSGGGAIASIEQSVLANVDIINMSLGGGTSASGPTTMAYTFFTLGGQLGNERRRVHQPNGTRAFESGYVNR